MVKFGLVCFFAQYAVFAVLCLVLIFHGALSDQRQRLCAMGTYMTGFTSVLPTVCFFAKQRES